MASFAGLSIRHAPERRRLTGPLDTAVRASGLLLIWSLFSYTQSTDDVTVPVGILASQVVKQASPLAHQL